MAREDHQPWPESPERPERTPDEMRKVCGRTIAFILALDKNVDGSNPDIDWALTQAKRARVAAAIVLAAPALVDVAIDATRSAGRKGNTLVQALEYDPSAAIPLTREAGDFELFGLPYGLLMTARAVSEGLHDDYDAVLIMDAVTELFDRIVDRDLVIRRLTIVANRIVRENDVKREKTVEQIDLFCDYEEMERQRQAEEKALAREKSRQKAVLNIKNRFGKNAILRGMDLEKGATARERNAQIGGHKA